MLTTVLAFLLTLAVLIVVHEWGHYRVAVACGVKVLRFSVGFGRVVLRRQATPDGTEFVLSALPLGGYVRMLDAREGPVAPHEQGMAFNNKPLWQRAAIVAAGPVANLVLAVLLYATGHWIGTEEPKAVLGTPVAGSEAERAGLRAGDWVRARQDADGQWHEVLSLTDLRWHVTQGLIDREPLVLEVSDRDGSHRRQLRLALDGLGQQSMDAALVQQVGLGPAYSPAVMGEVKVGGPAAAAGLRQGDLVLRVDGLPVDDASSLRQRIRTALDGERARTMQWEVDRDGQRLQLTVTPRVLREGDRTLARVDAFIGSAPETVTVRLDLLDSVVRGADRTWEVSVLTVRMIGRMLTGEASVRNLSGPLTIADAAGHSVQQGLAYYLGFLALVSVSLGVLNLLPLPMLDGGHLMYYIFEALTGRPVSDAWLARLQRGGVAVLLLMMSVALYNDVARLLGLQ